jgi:hypothetical protein
MANILMGVYADSIRGKMARINEHFKYEVLDGYILISDEFVKKGDKYLERSWRVNRVKNSELIEQMPEEGLSRYIKLNDNVLESEGIQEAIFDAVFEIERIIIQLERYKMRIEVMDCEPYEKIEPFNLKVGDFFYKGIMNYESYILEKSVKCIVDEVQNNMFRYHVAEVDDILDYYWAHNEDSMIGKDFEDIKRRAQTKNYEGLHHQKLRLERLKFFINNQLKIIESNL